MKSSQVKRSKRQPRQVKGIYRTRKVKEDKDKDRGTSKGSQGKRKDGKGERHKGSIMRRQDQGRRVKGRENN
jgi:hypothetical protein